MRKLNKYMLVASAVAVMGIFTGCASNNENATTAATEAATVPESVTADLEVKDPGTIDERENVTTGEEYGNPVVDLKRMAEDFGGLLGQTDDKTVALLGEGVMEPAEGEEISVREYKMRVFDTETITDVLYNEEKVVGIQLIPDGITAEECQTQLTEALGEAGSVEEKTNDGNSMQSILWTVGNYNVEVLDAYGIVSIQITPAQ